MRLTFALSFAALAALVVQAPGLAGTVAHPTDGGAPVSCSANTGYIQSWSGGELPGLDGLPEGSGVITQWKVQAGTGGTLALQILRGKFSTFTPVGESAVETLTPSTLNTFNTRIPVAIDNQNEEKVLGLRIETGSPDCLYSGFPYDEVSDFSPAPVVGSGPTQYGSADPGFRLNLQVVAEDDEDGDGFGDATQDGCDTNPQRTDDCVKPDVDIYKTKIGKLKAKIFFNSDDPAATFECHLTKKPFKPCTSPAKLKKLKPKRYTFTVRAIDANNNKSIIDTFFFRPKGD